MTVRGKSTALESPETGRAMNFAGQDLEWAELKFSPKSSRWVASQTWHPKQRSRVAEDGSYLLEVPYADDRELVMEILKYGPEVEVLAEAGIAAVPMTVITS